MSNDGTTPPSIAPARATPGASAVRTGPQRTLTDPPTPASPVSRPATSQAGATQVSPPQPAPARPSAGPTTTAYRPDVEEETPSIGERLKSAAAAVAETARNALPTRDHDEDDRPVEHARPGGTPSHDRRTEPTAAAAATPSGPRRVRLAVARIDPWSVMKLSFLLSVAVGIMIVVASAVVWQTLDSLAVFTSLNDTIAEVTGSADFFPLLEYVAFDRMMSLATMIAVVDVVLLTALATIGAFLYNLVAALVGGIHLTLTDD